MTTQPSRPGHDRRLCGSLKRDGSGDTCTLPAGWGTSHVGAGLCRKHLGNSPNAITHAQHLMAADAAAQFGVAIDSTPEDALMDALAHAAGQVVFYRARVAELTRDQMTFGNERITRTQRLPGGGDRVLEDVTVAKSRPHVWVQLLHEAQRHYAEVAKTCAVLNIEQRRVALAETHGSFIYETVDRVLRQYGVRDDPLLPTVVGEVMRELTDD